MKKILFIINPKSGVGNKNILTSIINKKIDRSIFETEICFTEAPGHATFLAAEAVKKNFEYVIAVGGDGSVNETAAALINSDTALGIIPTGSGNGMARHLKIPVDLDKSLSLINAGVVDKIDTMDVNGQFGIGTIGIGFDAFVAHLFAKAGKRGYSTYVKLVLTEFYSFREKHFSILADGNLFESKCFLLTFANSSQFGNNAVIAPFANVKDGIIDISMVKKFPIYTAPSLIWRMMNNNIHQSKFFSSLRAKNIIVKNDSVIQGHIDGEPVTFTGDITIKINPLSLKIIVNGQKDNEKIPQGN